MRIESQRNLAELSKPGLMIGAGAIGSTIVAHDNQLVHPDSALVRAMHPDSIAARIVDTIPDQGFLSPAGEAAATWGFRGLVATGAAWFLYKGYRIVKRYQQTPQTPKQK